MARKNELALLETLSAAELRSILLELRAPGTQQENMTEGALVGMDLLLTLLGGQIRLQPTKKRESEIKLPEWHEKPPFTGVDASPAYLDMLFALYEPSVVALRAWLKKEENYAWNFRDDLAQIIHYASDVMQYGRYPSYKECAQLYKTVGGLWFLAWLKSVRFAALGASDKTYTTTTGIVARAECVPKLNFFAAAPDPLVTAEIVNWWLAKAEFDRLLGMAEARATASDRLIFR